MSFMNVTNRDIYIPLPLELRGPYINDRYDYAMQFGSVSNRTQSIHGVKANRYVFGKDAYAMVINPNLSSYAELCEWQLICDDQLAPMGAYAFNSDFPTTTITVMKFVPHPSLVEKMCYATGS